MIERIRINYHGIQAEIVYQPGEVVFQTTDESKPYDHKTFTGVTPAQWEDLKIRLTTPVEPTGVIPLATQT